MESIAREPIADDLGEDGCAARYRMLALLEHHDARAFAHDEAVAMRVIGARCTLRLIVEAGGQGAASCKACERKPVDRRFGASRHHHLGIIQRDQACRIADRMRSRGAGRDDGMIRPPEAELDRHIA